MKDLGAKEGDFAYISDTRWYLVNKSTPLHWKNVIK